MLSKKNSCQTIVTSRKQIVQENIQQWWQTNAPTETGLTQNYGIIQKCIENGLPHSKGILRISKVYRQMANNCTTSVRRTKMFWFFGYCLSIVEEFFFLGFISAIVAMVFFHSSPMAFFSQMNNSASFSSAFFSYLFFSIFLYPLCLLLSVICQKKGWLYGEEYTDNSFAFDFIFDIYNDLIFPIYALLNRKEAPVSAIIFISLWIIDVILIIVGFFTAF